MQGTYCRDELPGRDLSRTEGRAPHPARPVGHPRLRFAVPRPPLDGRGHVGRRILLPAGSDYDPRNPAAAARDRRGRRRAERTRASVACRSPSRRNTPGNGAGAGPPAEAQPAPVRSGGSVATTPMPCGAVTSASTPAAGHARTAGQGIPGHLPSRPRACVACARGPRARLCRTPRSTPIPICRRAWRRPPATFALPPAPPRSLGPICLACRY